jgi:hypothetical protein
MLHPAPVEHIGRTREVLVVFACTRAGCDRMKEVLKGQHVPHCTRCGRRMVRVGWYTKARLVVS